MECYSSTQAPLNTTQESPCGASFQALMEDPSHSFPYKYLMPKMTHCSCQSWQQQQPLSVSNCFPASSTVLPLHWETGSTLDTCGSRNQCWGCWECKHHWDTSPDLTFLTHHCMRALWKSGGCALIAYGLIFISWTGFYTKGCSWLWLRGCYLRNDTEVSDGVMVAPTHVYWETARCASTGGNSSKSPATFCFSGSVCSVLNIINFSHI